MALALSLLVAVLFAGAVYLLMQGDRLRNVLGFALLANAVNLAIVAGGGWSPGTQPPLLEGATQTVEVHETRLKISTDDPARYADPIPQALVLTAIVIGFAMLTFMMVLAAYADDPAAESDSPPETTGESSTIPDVRGDRPSPTDARPEAPER